MDRKLIILSNPFVLYAVTWLTVFAVYKFSWSRLCPSLYLNLYLFLLITSILSFCIGLIIHKKGYLKFRLVKPLPVRLLKRALIILYILFVFEIIVARGVPLINLLKGDTSILYTEFGLPFLHVIVVNGFSIVYLLSIYILKLNNGIEKKKILYYYIMISLVPFFLMVNRGALMNNILCYFILTLILSSNVRRTIYKTIFGALSVLFLFGLLGNLRSDVNGTSAAILSIGQATDEFKESVIPKEFFWGYLYIATPLANTQNTIDNYLLKNIEIGDITKLVINECLPVIISKRISNDNSKYSAVLIVDQLNVASVYGRIYTYVGWPGFYFMFLFTLFFITVNLGLISRKSLFYIPMIIVLDEIIIMNLFSNMFVFMGLVPQLLIFIILSKFTKY